ncbi:MAG: T9SS type A sorting domain-containing protein [Bacteroidota bacterium]
MAVLPLFGSTGAACVLGDRSEPYEATVFATDTDGPHTVSVIEPIQTIADTDDTVLLVYDGTFNPASACDHFLGIGNETPGTGLPIDLTSGNYVLVVAGFLGTGGTYTARIEGPTGSTVGGDLQPMACTMDAPLSFGTFDATGDDATYGEFAEILNASTAPGDLTLCSFATFDVYMGTVIYTAEAAGLVAGSASYVFATMNGDQALPPESLADAPGAFVLLEGTTSVGATVADVLPKVVAGLVYTTEDDIYAQVGGGATAEERTTFADAFNQLVAAEDAPGTQGLALGASPNPFRERSTLVFGLEEATDVHLVVFDLLGRQVALLADAPFSAGRHTVPFEAEQLPEGTYIVRLTAAHEHRATLRLTVLR